MKPGIVINAGGSVFIQEEPDVELMKEFAALLGRFPDYKFYIVMGGGRLARQVISHARNFEADESYLDDVTKAKDEKETGRGEAAIGRLLEASGDLRVVRAIGRFRHSEKAARALGAIAKKGGESGGLAVEYLCRALGSSNPKVQATAKGELAGLSDPELVSLLVRSLDDPKLGEPIRDVLKQINTPEARKALGQE